MDSLVDEGPLVLAGLLSAKIGSSLYIKYISNPCIFTKQSAGEAAHHRGRRDKVNRSYKSIDGALKGPFLRLRVM
jgi:hypothetical protein